MHFGQYPSYFLTLIRVFTPNIGITHLVGWTCLLLLLLFCLPVRVVLSSCSCCFVFLFMLLFCLPVHVVPLAPEGPIQGTSLTQHIQRVYHPNSCGPVLCPLCLPCVPGLRNKGHDQPQVRTSTILPQGFICYCLLLFPATRKWIWRRTLKRMS